MEIRKVGGIVPLAREVVYGTPLAPVSFGFMTAEESAARAMAFLARKAAAQPRLHAVMETLNALTGVEREILDLHTSDGDGYCDGCDFGGYEGEPPSWPCRTVSLVARRNNVEIPEDMDLYDKDWRHS